MSETVPTVFIVDNDPVSRAALSTLVGTMRHLSNDPLSTQQFATAEDFLRTYRGEPGCLISELQLPGLSAVELFDKLTEQERELPLIVTAGSMSISTAVDVMRHGAFTILEKLHHYSALFSAVHAALNEDVELRIKRQEQLKIRNRMAILNPIEYRVMKMMVTGMPSKTMALQLDRSVRTVENHRRTVFDIMHVGSIAMLVQDLVVAFGGQRLNDCLPEFAELKRNPPASS